MYCSPLLSPSPFGYSLLILLVHIVPPIGKLLNCICQCAATQISITTWGWKWRDLYFGLGNGLVFLVTGISRCLRSVIKMYNIWQWVLPHAIRFFGRSWTTQCGIISASYGREIVHGGQFKNNDIVICLLLPLMSFGGKHPWQQWLRWQHYRQYLKVSQQKTL